MTKKGGTMKEEILAAIQAISEKIRQLETAKQALEELVDSGPWTRTKKPALADERETWASKPARTSPRHGGYAGSESEERNGRYVCHR